MTPEALAKLWRRHGSVPYCTEATYKSILDISERLRETSKAEQVKFWGVVEERFRTRNYTMLHCFNFGNTTVKYPWEAEAVNFGHRFPLTITGSGTVRLKKSDRTMLHRMETPFLSFPFSGAPMLVEKLQPGYLVCEKGSGKMRSSFDVVMADGSTPPSHNGILFYFLTKRLPFTVEATEPVAVPGTTTFPACRVVLAEPMIVETGWPVLMLEGDRYVWGVVH